MKTIIEVTMDSKVAFKFDWREKGSLISHVGQIVQEEKIAERGVLSLGAVKNTAKQGDKARWESQIVVPAWIERAMEYVFFTHKALLAAGIPTFTIECTDVGTKPVIRGLVEKVDRSWMDGIPRRTWKKSSTETKAVEDTDDAEAAADKALS